MTYFETLGIGKDYKERELDANFNYLINLIYPYVDEDKDLACKFIDIDFAYDALKSNTQKYKVLDSIKATDNERIALAHQRFINSQFMINQLEENIGKFVNVIYNENGNIIKKFGYLESVHTFNFIKLMGQPAIPFIDYNIAIMSVTNSQNKPIYLNPNIGYSYHIEFEEDLLNLYELSWGNTIGLIYNKINAINNVDVTKKVLRK